MHGIRNGCSEILHAGRQADDARGRVGPLAEIPSSIAHAPAWTSTGALWGMPCYAAILRTRPVNSTLKSGWGELVTRRSPRHPPPVTRVVLARKPIPRAEPALEQQ